jgi:hypothetical protein
MSYGFVLTYSELVARHLPDAELNGDAKSGMSLSDAQKHAIRTQLASLKFSINELDNGDWQAFDYGLGIDVSVFDDEAGMGIAYWIDEADKAKKAFNKIRLTAIAIEKITGFVTYDPQIGKVVDWDNDIALMLEAYL